MAESHALPEDRAAAEKAAGRELARLRESGARARDAVASVAAVHGLSRRRAYQLWLETGQG